MKQFIIGALTGVIAAVINVAFLFMAPGLKISVFIATAITWIVTGIMISLCSLKINAILKGMLIAILISASSLVYVVTSSPSGAVWNILSTLVWGAIMGVVIDKLGKYGSAKVR